jgi:hypothetical protein
MYNKYLESIRIGAASTLMIQSAFDEFIDRIVRNSLDSKDYLKLGFYALAYHERADLTCHSEQPATTLPLQSIAEKIYQYIRGYYKYVKIIPKIIKTLESAYAAKFDYSSPELMLDIELLADTILKTVEHPSLASSEATEDPKNIDDTQSRRQQYNSYFMNNLLQPLIGLISAGVDPYKITLSIYEKCHLCLTDAIVDYYYYQPRMGTGANYIPDKHFKATLLLEEQVPSALDSADNFELLYAWTKYISESSPSEEDIFPEMRLGGFTHDERAKVIARAKKFIKKIASPQDKYSQQYQMIMKRVRDGIKELRQPHRTAPDAVKKPLYRISVVEVVRLRVPPIILEVLKQHNRLQSQSDSPRVAPPTVDYATPNQPSLHELIEQRTFATQLRIVSNFKILHYDNIRWMNDNVLLKFLFQNSFESRYALPSFQLTASNHSFEERMTALIFYPLCVICFYNFSYDNIILKGRYGERSQEEIAAYLVKMKEMKANVLKFLKDRALMVGELQADQLVPGFIDSLFTDPLLTMNEELDMISALQKFHVESHSKNKSLFYQILLLDSAAHLRGLDPEIRAGLTETSSLPIIFRKENLLQLIANSRVYNLFSAITPLTTPFDYTPCALGIVEMDSATSVAPFELIHFLTQEIWSKLHHLVKARFAELRLQQEFHRLAQFEAYSQKSVANTDPVSVNPSPSNGENGETAPLSADARKLSLVARSKCEPQMPAAPTVSIDPLHELSSPSSIEPQQRTVLSTSSRPLRVRPPSTYVPPVQQLAIMPTIYTIIKCTHLKYPDQFSVTLEKCMQSDGSCFFKAIFSNEHLHYFYVPNIGHSLWKKDHNLFPLLISHAKENYNDLFSKKLVAFRDDNDVYYKYRVMGQGGAGNVRFYFTRAETPLEHRKNLSIFALAKVERNGHVGSGKAKY